MIKVAFFDIDGTLVSHKTKCVPDSAKEALIKLRKNDVLIVAATGRHILEFPHLFLDDVEFDSYILLNGQLCLDSSKNVLFCNPIKDIKTLKQLFNDKAYPLQMVEEHHSYINYINEYTRSALNDVSTPLPPLGEFLGNPVFQSIAYVDELQQKELHELLPNCKITRWNEKGIDILSKDGGKLNGIKRYLELFNIDIKDTIAFGDGDNDVEMLKYVNIGVAMGNAPTFVKEVADYITTDIDDNGIANAISHFFQRIPT